MKFLTLNHIALHVADLEKSIFFYQYILELPVLPRPAFDFAGAWFGLGEAQELHLIAGRQAEVNAGSRGTHFALSVSSIQEAEKFLKAKQVNYQAPKQRPDGVWQIFLEDPDGYCIEICER